MICINICALFARSFVLVKGARVPKPRNLKRPFPIKYPKSELLLMQINKVVASTRLYWKGCGPETGAIFLRQSRRGESRMKKEVKNVAVIGAGRMGHGIAETFIRTGKEVFLCDLSTPLLKEAVELVEQELTELSEWGAMPRGEIKPTMDRLHCTTLLEEAASNADVVIEAVPENLEIKKGVFHKLDAICPERTVLASNSSFFGPSEYASATNRPDRVLGAHYFYPPHLIPLVEVVRSESTSDASVEIACDLLKSSEKTPLVVKKEVRGFIANRLQYALQREAFYLVEQGICFRGGHRCRDKSKLRTAHALCGNRRESGNVRIRELRAPRSDLGTHISASLFDDKAVVSLLREAET